MAELSHALPARLVLHTMPCSANSTLEVLAGVLAAPIGVMQQFPRATPAPDRHHRVRHEL